MMSGQDEGQWSEDVWRIWERNRWKWQKKTLIPVINISWLSLSDAGFFGCVICKMTKQNNEYANFEVVTHNFNNMKRHASSKQHLQALGQLELIDVPADEDAPSSESFEAVARGRMKGPVALRHGETGVGGRKKITHMVQCLGAAIVELDRRFLASAETITLHTDVRKLKLLVRFRAANFKLDSKRGILGIKDLKSALAIISIFFSIKKHGESKTDAAFFYSLTCNVVWQEQHPAVSWLRSQRSSPSSAGVTRISFARLSSESKCWTLTGRRTSKPVLETFGPCC